MCRAIIAALVLFICASRAAAQGETCGTAHDCGACPAGEHAECVVTRDAEFMRCVCKDGPASCAAAGGRAAGGPWALALPALFLVRRRPWRRG